MRHVNVRVMKVLTIMFAISFGLFAGNRIKQSRAEQVRTNREKASVSQQQSREKADEDARSAEISLRDWTGDFDVMPATGFPQKCTPSVSSLSAEFWENTPFADDVFANIAWTCGAGTDSTGCQTVIVVILYKDGQPYPSLGNNLFHRDTVEITCRGTDSYDYSVQLGAVSLPDGYYQASVNIYPGNWAELVAFDPMPPIIAHTQIGWTVD